MFGLWNNGQGTLNGEGPGRREESLSTDLVTLLRASFSLCQRSSTPLLRDDGSKTQLDTHIEYFYALSYTGGKLKGCCFPTLLGRIRLMQLHFHKKVFIRFRKLNWFEYPLLESNRILALLKIGKVHEQLKTLVVNYWVQTTLFRTLQQAVESGNTSHSSGMGRSS